MKIILVLTLLFITEPDLEHYIGKQVSEVENVAYVDETALGRLYQLEVAHGRFNGKPFHCITLETYNDGIIARVGITFEEKVDKSLFDLLVEKYGEPSRMLKMGTIIQEEAIEGNGYIAKSSKGLAQGCEFEDGPSYIGWRLPNHFVEVQISPDSDRTFVYMGKSSLIPLN
ncbi:hypothetical protein WIW50_06590 [Flavobacteriaceae bacterium 3-367]